MSFIDDDALVIRGEIETSSVPELLRSFVGGGEDGVLVFRNGELTKTLYVLDRHVAFAASNNPDERLGEALLMRGKITARHYVEASRLIRPGRRLGAILVELSAIEPEDLLPAVESQVKETVVDLISWTRGEYEFTMKQLDAESMVTVNLPVENLILEGIRRSRSWSQITRGLSDIANVLIPTGHTEVLYRLELTEEEQEILSHVNGRNTVEQICDVSYLSNFETCRMLWAFAVLGLVRTARSADEAVVSAGEEAKRKELDLEEIVEKFNQMFNRIYTFLRGRMGDNVDEFMDEALADVSRQYGTLFYGVDLKHYGRADYEQMLANVADLPADQRKSLMVTGLNELVYVLQYAVRAKQGAQEEAVVSGIIKDGFRRLGFG